MSGLFGSSKRVKTEAEKKAEKVQDGQSASADVRRAAEMTKLQARQKTSKRGGLWSLFSSQSGRTTNALGGGKSLLGKSNLGKVHY